MKEHGYVEGHNLRMECRYLEGQTEGLTIPPSLLAWADQVIE